MASDDAAQIEDDPRLAKLLEEEAVAARQIEESVMLDEVLKSSASVGAFGQKRDEAISRRDAAIRAAFKYGINRSAIAKAAGMRRERVYQIIDGR